MWQPNYGHLFSCHFKECPFNEAMNCEIWTLLSIITGNKVHHGALFHWRISLNMSPLIGSLQSSPSLSVLCVIKSIILHSLVVMVINHLWWNVDRYMYVFPGSAVMAVWRNHGQNRYREKCERWRFSLVVFWYITSAS